MSFKITNDMVLRILLDLRNKIINHKMTPLMTPLILILMK